MRTWAPRRPAPDRLTSFLAVPVRRPGQARVIVSIPNWNGIDTAHPAIQIDVATTARAERPVCVHGRLAADRAGLFGYERRASHDNKIGSAMMDGSVSRFRLFPLRRTFAV
jgi:hypothetical protein